METPFDGVSKAVQVDPNTQVGSMIVPVGPMMWAQAKHLNKSLQALVCIVQQSIGAPNMESNLVTLLQATDEDDSWKVEC